MAKFIALLLCFGLLGCASTSLNESYGNDKLTQENIEKIKIGATTREEVLSLFGQPYSKTKNNFMDMWIYSHTKSKTTSAPFFSLAGPTIDMQSKSVVFSFDEKGIVKDISSTEINPVQPASVSITENK